MIRLHSKGVEGETRFYNSTELHIHTLIRESKHTRLYALFVHMCCCFLFGFFLLSSDVPLFL